MKKLSNKGFTLVELIIVIAILAIIMLIAIPNFSGIQQRMQVRADKSSAAQIGKAVRIWYTEYTSDAAFKEAVDNDADKVALPKQDEANPVEMVKIDDIAKLNEYVDTTMEPSSLRATANNIIADPQYYYVGIVGSGTSEKVIVAISDEDNVPEMPVPVADNPDTTDVDESDIISVQYTGDYKATGKKFSEFIAYLEP